MPNFSFVAAGLAGSAAPATAQHLQELLKCGIKVVISLTEDALPDILREKATAQLSQLKCHHFPVDDYTAPTPKQLDDIWATVKAALDAREKVLVHCYGGIGRTGTVLACCLCRLQPDKSSQEVIDFLRVLRRRSIETSEQLQAVHDFH